MKIVSFNIRSGNDVKSGHSHDERAPLLKATVDKYDPDIIGFQEVVPAWMKHIPEDYGEKYEYFHKYRDTRTDIEGCTILWRKGMFECLDQGAFWYSDTPEIPSRGWCSWGHYRFCLWVKLKNLQNGDEFYFFDTHFGFSDQCHIDSVRLIRDHIKFLKADAAIVVGDFNMTQNGPGYRDITKFMVDVNKATVNDISITCHGYNAERTGIPIDFVFTTPHTVKPVTYHKMDETYNGKFPSDHYGLYAELEICKKVTAVGFNAAFAGEETEQEAEIRMSSVASRLSANTIAVVKNAHPSLQGKMERRGCAGAGDIYWKASEYTLEENLGDAVVLKSIASGKKLCVTAGGKAACGLPTIAAVTEMPFGSEAYAAMRECYQDIRREVAPRDLTPTYHGMAADMVAPMLESHIFYGGEIAPLSYKVVESVNSKNCYFADRNMVVAEFIV